jgi:hypothetical protein
MGTDPCTNASWDSGILSNESFRLHFVWSNKTTLWPAERKKDECVKRLVYEKITAEKSTIIKPKGIWSRKIC